MKIKTAEYAGFCFGVKRAVDAVSELVDLRPNAQIYTIGQLIHNPAVTEKLSKKGVVTVRENELEQVLAEAPARSVFVVRTHGIPLSIKEKLTAFVRGNPEAEILDMTCPFVAKIYKIMDDNTNDNTFTILLGDSRHPEVIGISSHIKGSYRVFADCGEIESAYHCGELHLSLIHI